MPPFTFTVVDAQDFEPSALTHRYKDALQNMPSPGGGGCHASLLGAATLGVMIGLTNGQLLTDIYTAIPRGSRHVPEREILSAIQRARQDTMPMAERPNDWQPPRPTPKPKPRATRETRDKLISHGKGMTAKQVMELSPVPVKFTPEEQSLQLLQELYRGDEFVFAGERYDKDVTTVTAHRAAISDESSCPFIIPNPMTGKLAETQNGSSSYRCDAAVASHRFTVAEFDNIPLSDQLAFWASISLPITALIYSGGKSIHAWIRVDLDSAEEWQGQVKDCIYGQYLIPMGVDPACRNSSRLIRFPGHRRADTGRIQQLLYLNPIPNKLPIINKAAIQANQSQINSTKEQP